MISLVLSEFSDAVNSLKMANFLSSFMMYNFVNGNGRLKIPPQRPFLLMYHQGTLRGREGA